MKNTRNNAIYCWLERLFLLLLALYLLKSAEYMTTFNLSPFVPVWTDRFLLIALSIVTIPKVLLLLADPVKRLKQVRLIACALAVSLLWLLVYFNDRYVFLLYFSVLTLGCVGTDYRTLLKVQVCVVGAVVLAAALCCMGGAIENRIYWGHDRIRSSFGYTYPTNMAAYYFYLCVAAWVAWDRTWDPVFLIPAVLSLFITGVVADSRTCFLCGVFFCVGILWCWLARYNGNNLFVQNLEKVINCACRNAFPLFATIALALTVAYHQEIPFALKLNDWLSTRLSLQANALYQHGLHLLGNAFEMRGLASGFPVLDLNYVDCCYMQLLLQYGILAFLAYSMLWPIMTDVAIKAKKDRLAVGLTLMALHALCEQHFLFVDCNILLVAPFSIVSLHTFPESENCFVPVNDHVCKIKRLASFVAIVIMILTILLVWKPLLSGFRTLWNVLLSPNLTIQLYQRRAIFFASIGFQVACLLLFFLIKQIIASLLTKQKPLKRHIALLMLCFAIAGIVTYKGNDRLNRAMVEYDPYLEEDLTAVSLAKEIDDLQLYQSELPTLYKRRFSTFSTSFFNGEDLGRLHNIAVITDSDHMWTSMFQSGFSYAEISDKHAIYTDSQALIDSLNKAGFAAVPYYSKEMSVNMDRLSEWNQLPLYPDGSVVLSDDHPLLNVPDVDLKPGQYTFSFDISVLKPEDVSMKETAFFLSFTDNSGARKVLEELVRFDQFDINGDLSLEVSHWFDAAGVEFKLIPENGVILKLHSVTYRITP